MGAIEVPADTCPADARFQGLGRLYGRAAIDKLRRAHVCVIGLGGVGSWAVEALARSGIGNLTLVDFDEACLSNINRQVQALQSTIGRAKGELLAERIAGINPNCRVVQERRFFTESTAERLLSTPYDVILDAIDSFSNKCLLIAACRRQRISLVTCGGAGGLRDPSLIHTIDLARTRNDPLLALVRKKLRRDYGFPAERKRKWKIDCVFSPELPAYPQADGTVRARRDPEIGSMRLNCDAGFGTACFITGTFGFHMAGRAVEKILAAPESPANPQKGAPRET